MHLLPLALGIVAILVGIAMVAFGIPINEFGTGNTLIAAGTTAIIGGFILLGLWAAVLQLQRLLGALEPRSTRAASGAAAELERARHQARAETAVAGPYRGPRPLPEHEPEREPPPSALDDTEEPGERPWLPQEEPGLPVRERAPDDRRPAPREGESSWELFAPARSSGPAREHSFDAIWPSERPGREGARDAGRSEDRGRVEERSPERGLQPSAGAEPATILKSGVINGMAYTLYTDGSIEAELPQGTLRFRSLDELRDYLADNP
jgi:hypothetical protein